MQTKNKYTLTLMGPTECKTNIITTYLQIHFFTRKLTYICYFELTHINTYELTTTHDGRGDGYERGILYLQILCSDGGETAQPTKKEAGGGTADGEGGGRRHDLVRCHGRRERGDGGVGEAGAGKQERGGGGEPAAAGDAGVGPQRRRGAGGGGVAIPGRRRGSEAGAGSWVELKPDRVTHP